MAEHIILSTDLDELTRPTDNRLTQARGSRRVVKMVPIDDAGTCVPCVWRSPDASTIRTEEGIEQRVYECVILLCKKPLMPIVATVPVEVWENLREEPVEW
jgi:hypothetical protein